jgi:hypothetical protein
MYELNLCLPTVHYSCSQGLTGAIKQNYEQCLPRRLQQQITKTQQTYKVLIPDAVFMVYASVDTLTKAKVANYFRKAGFCKVPEIKKSLWKLTVMR